MITILGIDPGLANLGWGVISVKSQKMTLQDFGSIRSESCDSIETRVQFLGDACRELLEKYAVDAVSIEDIYFYKNKSSAVSIAKVIGAVYYIAGVYGASVSTYSPLQIKISITGMGRAEKFQVQEMIKILLGLKSIPTPDHAADALAAAVCHYTHMAGNQRLGIHD